VLYRWSAAFLLLRYLRLTIRVKNANRLSIMFTANARTQKEHNNNTELAGKEYTKETSAC